MRGEPRSACKGRMGRGEKKVLVWITEISPGRAKTRCSFKITAQVDVSIIDLVDYKRFFIVTEENIMSNPVEYDY